MNTSPFNRSRETTINGSLEAAFTRVDLLAVAFALVLCFALLLPALARTQPDSRVFQCFNNHRQLTRAWLMYAADNDGRLAKATHGLNSPTEPWTITGWLDWNLSTDNTNTVMLSDPRYSLLANYNGRDARPFKCPADEYLSLAQRARGWVERVRSVSQNLYTGDGNVITGPFDPSFVQVTKLTGLLNPKPADTWVALDEHPDSINDGGFFAPRTTEWIDLPANYHDGGAGIAFADGRAEIHRWQASVLTVPVRFQFSPLVTPAGDPDIQWLRSRTPRRQ